MAAKLIVLLGMAIAQADDPPALLTCAPESITVTNEGADSAWSCRDRQTNCEPRSFDPATFESHGAEQILRESSEADGITAESVTRLLADGRFEEDVQWRDGNGVVTFRQVTRGRCEQG